jgi:hypothetical protein
MRSVAGAKAWDDSPTRKTAAIMLNMTIGLYMFNPKCIEHRLDRPR